MSAEPPPRSLAQRRRDTEHRLANDVDVWVASSFAARAGFDPRTLTTPYRWFRVTPRRLQAWREENELSGRDLMREGRWLD